VHAVIGMTRRTLIAGVMIALGAPLTAAAAPTSRCEKNPAVIARLDEMGSFLRGQRTFSVRAQSTTDEVLEDGQKIQLGATDTLEVQRPDRLHGKFTSDRRQREFFYDGKTFTVYGPTNGYYAQVAAPPTIDGLLGRISDRYGIDLPLADLFRWGTPRSSIDDVTCATFIGPAKVGGVMTDQFALRQDGLDWQIWVEQGPRPLPRKLVLTTTDDPARPQHAVALDWDLKPEVAQEDFRFVPPRTASRITIVDLGS
jgi:hypothetical protein